MKKEQTMSGQKSWSQVGCATLRECTHYTATKNLSTVIHSPGGRGRWTLQGESAGEHSQIAAIPKEEAVVGSLKKKKKNIGQSFINPLRLHSNQRKVLQSSSLTTGKVLPFP